MHGVWCTKGSYYLRKLHNVAKEQVFVLSIFVLSVNVCNLSMNLIGKINAGHGSQLSLAKDT